MTQCRPACGSQLFLGHARGFQESFPFKKTTGKKKKSPFNPKGQGASQRFGGKERRAAGQRMERSREELEGEVQKVKPARDKGNTRAGCRPRGCRTRLPSPSCACKTPGGSPRLPNEKFFGDPKNQGRSVAAARNVRGEEMPRTGEVPEEKLRRSPVPRQSSRKADKELGLKCTQHFQRCPLQPALCSCCPGILHQAGQHQAELIPAKSFRRAKKKNQPLQSTEGWPGPRGQARLSASSRSSPSAPPVLGAKGAQSRATAGIDRKRRRNGLQRLFWGFSGCKHGVLQTGVERGWVCHLAAPLPGAREEAKSSPGTGSIRFRPKRDLAAFQERNRAVRGGRGFLAPQSSFLKKPRCRTHPALTERATSLLGTSCTGQPAACSTVGRGQPSPSPHPSSPFQARPASPSPAQQDLCPTAGNTSPTHRICSLLPLIGKKMVPLSCRQQEMALARAAGASSCQERDGWPRQGGFPTRFGLRGNFYVWDRSTQPTCEHRHAEPS